jgi:hypothetical protein
MHSFTRSKWKSCCVYARLLCDTGWPAAFSARFSSIMMRLVRLKKGRNRRRYYNPTKRTFVLAGPFLVPSICRKQASDECAMFLSEPGPSRLVILEASQVSSERSAAREICSFASDVNLLAWRTTVSVVPVAAPHALSNGLKHLHQTRVRVC